MKKLIIICLIIMLLVAGVVLFIVFNRHQSLVTGNINNLSEITVIKGRYSQEEIIKVLSPSDVKVLFEVLKDTRTAVVKHPKHLESMQNDPLYIIEVYYNDGKMDTIYTTEILVKFYRFINTKGPDGDSGYILSSKNEIILYLLEGYYQ